MSTFKLKHKVKSRKTRGKVKCRKTRGKVKCRTRRKVRGRTRSRKTRHVYKGGNIPATLGHWIGNGFGIGGTGFNESGNDHDGAVIRRLLIN